jgi:lipopolysaccharide/colanic/teichoic acid biosynthesis glycosyltransferase
MSIVGPRPLPVDEDGAADEWHKVRRMVKPGITCFWQATSRDEDDFDNWARLDIKYVRTFSFWIDIKIIIQTFFAVLSRKGAV